NGRMSGHPGKTRRKAGFPLLGHHPRSDSTAVASPTPAPALPRRGGSNAGEQGPDRPRYTPRAHQSGEGWMLPGWVLLLVSAGYAALPFAVAWIGDRYPLYPQRPWLRPLVYSLALAVYCSSWTFYGAVGTAVRSGIGYVPIYLGPILLLLFGWRILERMARVAQTQNTVSIADFIASRFGRSQPLAALVATIALIAAVPYLALQYKAVAISLDVLGGQNPSGPALGDPALYVAALMALFAILFGTRQVDATEHRPGMMLA